MPRCAKKSPCATSGPTNAAPTSAAPTRPMVCTKSTWAKAIPQSGVSGQPWPQHRVWPRNSRRKGHLVHRRQLRPEAPKRVACSPTACTEANIRSHASNARCNSCAPPCSFWGRLPGYRCAGWLPAGPQATPGSLWDIACLSLIFFGLLLLLDNICSALNHAFADEERVQ